MATARVDKADDDSLLSDPPSVDEQPNFDVIVKHGHQDLVQVVAFNNYGDRAATGSVDGKIRVFNRHKDGVWRLSDNWTAHGGEITEIQWLPSTIAPNLIASLGIEGRFKLWAEDPIATSGRRFITAKRFVRRRNVKLGPAPDGGDAIGDSADGTANPGDNNNNSNNGNNPGATSNPNVNPNANPNPNLNPNPYANPNPNPNPNNSNANPSANPSANPNAKAKARAAFETRNSTSPYRAFAMKYIDEAACTYLALATADGQLHVYENDHPENLPDFSKVDEFTVCPRPTRGDETAFCVRFDPNPDVCYTALRAGVLSDTLSLVVAAMDRVRVYRSRDTIRSSLGVTTAAKEFYLAAELTGHRGLVRDVAWAPGNIRGYDIIATACQDGFVRVFSLDCPIAHTTTAWSASQLQKHIPVNREEVEHNEEIHQATLAQTQINAAATAAAAAAAGNGNDGAGSTFVPDLDVSGVNIPLQHKSALDAGFNPPRANTERRSTGMPGQVRHVAKEMARLDIHRTPVWRVAFDDDGQVLGSVGDEGRLICYRQTPSGSWAKSSELSMMKMRMAVP
ncbi:WD40-repeat-containing domain protein [Lasiosphaeria miniovina]|uniref:WD40-repeat-containing domain protein n=1 Tax=Lasiosphaeria miniovina TaxID=1954250 RepID=A0AA40DVQ5_9PEZI|nr:WD40-repeat-containing domain protein [Lasiosphaeria miniovina]KAK0718114.1 WD40-repeat-containing domain protein [Lasiosphaeria miniovina]